MMRIRPVCFTVCVLLTLNSWSQDKKGSRYTIDASIDGLAGDSVHIFIRNAQKDASRRADTLVTRAQNDRFFLEGVVDAPQLVWVQLGGLRSRNSFSFFLEEGAIKISGRKDAAESLSITGTGNNNVFTSHRLAENLIYEEIKQLRAALKSDSSSEESGSRHLYSRINTLYDSISRLRIHFIQAHPDALISPLYLSILHDQIPLEQVEKLYGQLGPSAKNSEFAMRVKSRIDGKKRSASGNMAPSFSAADTSGVPVSLASFRGHYVLLDFWASWCVPCRKENPYLVSAYNKYKSKKFIIISISMDHIKESWHKAIVQDGLKWVHLSELNGLESQVARLYGVQPIPDNFLIDPEGWIIARKLYGDEIEKKLAELIKN